MLPPDSIALPEPHAPSSASVVFEDRAGLQGGVGAIGTSYAPVNIYNFASPPREVLPQRPRGHNLALKFLADRDEQERLIRDHLERFQASRRPIVLFAHGEASQSLDGFADRLGKETMRRLLGTLNKTNQVEWKWVPWPDRRPSEAEAVAIYKNNLSNALERSMDEVVEKLASYRRPVLLTSAHRENPDLDEQPCIRGILDYWASLPDLRSELSLIVVVAIAYADAKLSFFARFRGQPKPSALGNKLAQFNGYRSRELNVLVLPQLADVTLSEAEHWVRHWLQPPDIEETLKRVREAFGVTTAMPMERLASHLEKLVPKEREIIRQQ
jgi:hypothetical protein